MLKKILVIGSFLMFASMGFAESLVVPLKDNSGDLKAIDLLLTERSPKTFARYRNQESLCQGIENSRAWICSITALGKNYLLAIDTDIPEQTHFLTLRWMDDQENDFLKAKTQYLKPWKNRGDYLINHFIIKIEPDDPGQQTLLVARVDWLKREEKDPRPERCLVTYEVVRLSGNVLKLDQKVWYLLSGVRQPTRFNILHLPVFFIPKLGQGLDFTHVIKAEEKQLFLLDNRYWKLTKNIQENSVALEEQPFKPCKLSLREMKDFNLSLSLKHGNQRFHIATSKAKTSQDLVVPSGDCELLYGRMISQKKATQLWLTPPLNQQILAIEGDFEVDFGKQCLIEVEFEKVGKAGRICLVKPKIKTDTDWDVVRILNDKNLLPKMQLVAKDQTGKVIFSRYFSYRNKELQALTLTFPEECKEVTLTITIEEVTFPIKSESMTIVL